jgi:hypothetical protein
MDDFTFTFENTVLREIFGHKKDEVSEQSSILHNEELGDLYRPPVGGYDGLGMTVTRNARRILVGKPV